jgi:beta-galactosidase
MATVSLGMLGMPRKMFINPQIDNNVKDMYPFIFGAQYYRAPTPEPECWENDFVKMKQIGFTDVKFWVQWRWSHYSDDKFYFEDLDKLMDLALAFKFRVTLNIIFDVAPMWLYEKYPDAKQIMNNGKIIEPYVVGHRQIGGHPGPCYNHPGALEERKKFMEATVSHFKRHPALAMWDVWNEPELSFPQRTPDIDRMVCYCPFCQQKFIQWLKNKYVSLNHLNRVWGRCYETWEQVEVPRNVETFTDFIDWREFNIDTMTREARWRLDTVKQIDPDHIHYLHVVPDTLQPFNPVSTCANDFELAKMCDVFAASMNSGPIFPVQVVSAGVGKICYNVESHINGGNTNMYQAILGLDDVLQEYIPQIALGIKGFMFWQFRPEVLGMESPAWGLVNLDGSDRPVTKAVRQMWKKLSPYKGDLLKCFPLPAQIGILKSRKNEIFQFCTNHNFDSLASGFNAFAESCYWRSYNYRFISEEMLESGEMDGIRLLIVPSGYYMTEPIALKIDDWVQGGGILLTEAHLAAYNGTTGRHNRTVPGNGLAKKWGISEIDATSSYRLKLDKNELLKLNVSEDTKKLLNDVGVSGAKYFPIRLKSGNILWGAERYAKIQSSNAEPLGWFHSDFPCLVEKEVGKGAVVYCGTNIGEGSRKDKRGFFEILDLSLSKAGIRPNLNVSGANGNLRVDSLYQDNSLQFLAIRNTSGKSQGISMELDYSFKGIFSGIEINPMMHTKIPDSFCDLFCKI